MVGDNRPLMTGMSAEEIEQAQRPDMRGTISVHEVDRLRRDAEFGRKVRELLTNHNGDNRTIDALHDDATATRNLSFDYCPTEAARSRCVTCQKEIRKFAAINALRDLLDGKEEA